MMLIQYLEACKQEKGPFGESCSQKERGLIEKIRWQEKVSDVMPGTDTVIDLIMFHRHAAGPLASGLKATWKSKAIADEGSAIGGLTDEHTSGKRPKFQRQHPSQSLKVGDFSLPI